MPLAKSVFSFHDCTISVLDKEVYLTAPIAEYKGLTFFDFDGSTSAFSWNSTVTLSCLLSTPDINERSVWSKFSNAPIVNFSLSYPQCVMC